MKTLCLFFVGLILCLSSCSSPSNPVNDNKNVLHREFINHPLDTKKKIEILWSAPKGDGPWPVIFLIHGHQNEPRSGAEAFVDIDKLNYFNKKGLVAVAISQPGYGKSDGPSDYCGPFTQSAVRTVINYFQKKDFVNLSKFGLYGVSRGAIVASMVATQEPNLAAVIMLDGTFDLVEEYARLKNSSDKEMQGIAKNIEIESNNSEAELKQRSAFYSADKIKSPILILNGALDPRINTSSISAFATKVKKNGTHVELQLIKEDGHDMVNKKYRNLVNQFIEHYLLDMK